ncbi:MAG: hypothetical protein L6R35_005638 [Caloplaca aegaea]|nr:MAG: hypothetical protein L6R35_005638 [Caloplaca aegaea]
MAQSSADLQQQYTTYKNNLQQLAEKIGNVEQETEEHKYVTSLICSLGSIIDAQLDCHPMGLTANLPTRLVLETLTPLPKDRKCFRMINGVLVERTVKDVLPALQTNADGLKKLLDELVKQYKRQQEDMENLPNPSALYYEDSLTIGQEYGWQTLVHKAMRNHFAAVWRLLYSSSFKSKLHEVWSEPGRVGSSIIGRFFYVRTRQGTAQWSDMSGSVNVKYLGPEDIASTTLQGTAKSSSDLAIRMLLSPAPKDDMIRGSLGLMPGHLQSLRSVLRSCISKIGVGEIQPKCDGGLLKPALKLHAAISYIAG